MPLRNSYIKINLISGLVLPHMGIYKSVIRGLHCSYLLNIKITEILTSRIFVCTSVPKGLIPGMTLINTVGQIQVGHVEG